MRAAAVLPVLAAVLGGPARGDGLAARAAAAYALEPRPPAALAAGERGTVSLTIRCAPGVHVQRQAPLRVTASASPGLALAKSRLGWEDVRGAPDAPEVRVPVAATAPGAGEVRLHLAFFVCSKEWCARQEREVAVPVAAGVAPTRDAARSPAPEAAAP